ncbi:MAG TPA: M23 family metallopeptidase [Actinomycetota bacterium]|nr:M23 family metallopeptidase [Actinomycetota bacterium]
MRIRAAIAALLASVTILQPEVSGAGDGYLPAVAGEGGLVFPVARSRWFSVINFANDWHAPRFRFVEGQGWQLIGRHEGNDIFAEPGTPVRAMLGGVVEQLGWTFYSGWRVGIRGSDGRYWFYAHLRALPGDLSVGERVAAGRRIGRVGNTGYGPDPGHKDEFTYHLHLGIQEPDGTWINPYPMLKDLYETAVRTDP